MSRSLRRGPNFCATDEELAVGDQLAGTPLFDLGQRHSNAAKQARDRRKVLAWYVAYRQASPDEAAKGLGMDILAVRPRVTELTESGCLRETDLPRRSTGRGGTAAVWAVTLAGEREYQCESNGPRPAA